MTAMRDTSWIKRSDPMGLCAPFRRTGYMVRAFAFLSAAPAPFGKAALDKAS